MAHYRAGSSKAQLTFYVTNNKDPPLLVGVVCISLCLLRKAHLLVHIEPEPRDNLLMLYTDVFGTHHIFLDSRIPPIVQGCR